MGTADMTATQKVVYDGDPTVCGDLAAYEFYIAMMLQWLCCDCGAVELATDDIRDDEGDAPEGEWAVRKAAEAMNQGWFVLPLSENGSLLNSPCYCPGCAKKRELDINPPKNKRRHKKSALDNRLHAPSLNDHRNYNP